MTKPNLFQELVEAFDDMRAHRKGELPLRTFALVLRKHKYSLDKVFIVGDLPADRACPIEGTPLRVFRAPNEKRLIIWDDSHSKRTMSFRLDDDSDLRDHLRSAVEYFSFIV